MTSEADVLNALEITKSNIQNITKEVPIVKYFTAQYKLEALRMISMEAFKKDPQNNGN